MSKSNDDRWTEPQRRSRWRVQIFLLCLLISAFVWLLVKLSKDYQSGVVVPVVFSNVPSGMVFSGTTDSVLVLSIKSNGYNIIARKIFKAGQQISVNLSDLKLNKQGSYYEGILPEGDMKKRISEILGRNELLLGFSPVTVSFRCEQASFKKVPVVAKLNLNFADHHLLRGSIQCDPDSIMLTGPPDKIARITEIATETRTLKELNEDKDINIPLNKASFDRRVSLSSAFVKVHIPVAAYTDESIMVKVEPDTVLAKYSLKIKPEETKINFQVAVQDAGKVRASLFRVEVVYSGKMLKKSTLSRLEIREAPAFVRVTAMEPAQAEYTIIK